MCAVLVGFLMVDAWLILASSYDILRIYFFVSGPTVEAAGVHPQHAGLVQLQGRDQGVLRHRHERAGGARYTTTRLNTKKNVSARVGKGERGWSHAVCCCNF